MYLVYSLTPLLTLFLLPFSGFLWDWCSWWWLWWEWLVTTLFCLREELIALPSPSHPTLVPLLWLHIRPLPSDSMSVPSRQQVWGCQGSGLFRAFSRHLLHRLDVATAKDERVDGRVHITLLSRDTKYRRVLNEGQLIRTLERNETYVVRRVRVACLLLRL